MNKKKFVSVIIPVYDSQEYLEKVLLAIKKSDYQHFEIIVADDKSKDGSLNIAKRYADIIVEMPEQKGPALARNKAVEKANGELLFFIDSDVEIKPDTIRIVVEKMGQDPDVAAVFGSYDDEPLHSNFFSQYKNLVHHFVHQSAKTSSSTFWAGCGAIKKNIFLTEGGFQEKYTRPSIEDVELGYRMKKRGKKIILAKEVQVKHLKRWSFLSMAKTDIVGRAIPWTKLALENGLPQDLNFKIKHRLSGMLSCFLFTCLVLMWRWRWLVVLYVISQSLLVFINRDLYGFFMNKKGLIFTIKAVFFHWLYLFYSSVTFLVVASIVAIKKYM